MSNYKTVTDALAGGADSALLCQTCPWDRYCITPPSMTRSEVDAQVAEAKARDDEAAEKAKANGETSMPMGSLLMTLMVGAADTQAQICPVFANRLRSSAGRTLVDSVRSQMVGWDDGQVDQ